MKRPLFVLGALLLSSSLAWAQAPGGRGRGPGLPPPMNLQVLPKNFTIQQVLPIMQNITAALGVNCEYCHEVTGPGDPNADFASDMKPPKNKARVMMRMVQTINMTLGSQLGKPAAEVTRVGCITCHRGVAVPKQLVDILVETENQNGVQAALQQYRELRTKYYGAQAYDFSDATLFAAAQRADAANKPDDAIAFAESNLQFNPTSARSYQVMSQAYQRKNDMKNAIAMMEKAVEMEPMNRGFQNRLTQLKNPGQGRGQNGGRGQGGPARGRN
jgi:hypothetical protein